MSTVKGIFIEIQMLIDQALTAPTSAEKNAILLKLKKITTTDVVYQRLQAIETEPTYLIALPEKVDLRLSKS